MATWTAEQRAAHPHLHVNDGPLPDAEAAARLQEAVNQVAAEINARPPTAQPNTAET